MPLYVKSKKKKIQELLPKFIMGNFKLVYNNAYSIVWC